MASDLALEVEHLTKSFRVHHEKANSLKQLIAGRKRAKFDDFLALKDISFTVTDGEVFGVIGHNGSGKSTLLKCMAGILQPNSGSVRVARRMSALLELGAGFHPELTGRENIFLNAAILGMTRRDIAGRFDDIVEFSGLEAFIDQPVKTYSSGMYVRLAFAVAINVDPDLLIVDEILAVGDVTFQQRCMEKFVEFRNEGRTIVLVTHDLNSIQNLCDRALWLKHGEVSGEGDPARMVELYAESMLGARDRTVDGSVRRGSGEIEITHVEMFVGAGTSPVKRFRTGDDVRLRMPYTVNKAVAQPVFALHIMSLTGASMSNPCTRDVGLVPRMIDRDGVVEIVLKNVALLPGTYDLHVGISDFNRAHVYDHLHTAIRFDVMTGNPYETGGLMTFHPSWSIEQ